MFKKTKIRS